MSPPKANLSLLKVMAKTHSFLKVPIPHNTRFLRKMKRRWFEQNPGLNSKGSCANHKTRPPMDHLPRDSESRPYQVPGPWASEPSSRWRCPWAELPSLSGCQRSASLRWSCRCPAIQEHDEFFSKLVPEQHFLKVFKAATRWLRQGFTKSK